MLARNKLVSLPIFALAALLSWAGCSLLLSPSDYGGTDGDADVDADADADADADTDADTDADIEDHPPCIGGELCNDGDPCTTDRCDPGGPGANPVTGCSHRPAPDGTPCNEVLFCVVGEQCIGGSCNPDLSPGITFACDDGVNCTDDACIEAEDRCGEHLPRHDLCASGWCDVTTGCTDPSECSSHGECSDNNWCNGEEQCVAGRCVAGAFPCDDGFECTNDSCSWHECYYEPFDGRCSDGDLCTIDECRLDVGCAHRPTFCDDDGNPCTRDECNPANGICGMPANQGQPCDGIHVCVSGARCDATGYCDPSRGTPVHCPEDGNPCTVERCDVAAGGCHSVPASPGTPCEAPCRVGATCDSSGHCDPEGGSPLDCSTGDLCTERACVTSTNACGPSEAVCGSDGNCCESQCGVGVDPDCAEEDGGPPDSGSDTGPS